MIKATEAQANVINYEAAILEDIQNKVNELADIMSKSIEFHSKNGFHEVHFTPFDKSRFSNVNALETAERLFQKLFEEAGYTVLENHYGKNSLVIRW